MRLVDLSHTISDGLITYPGLPGPVISDHLSFDASHAVYDEGTEFSIGRIEMVSNTGTYLDTPGHRHRGGHDLSGLPLERCALLPGPGRRGRVDRRHRAWRRSRASTSPATPCWCAPAGTCTSAPRRTARPSTRSWPPRPPSGWPTRGSPWSGSTRSTSTTPAAASGQVHTLLLEREIPVVEHLTGLVRAAADRGDVHRRTSQGGRHVDVPGPGLRDAGG